MFQVLQIKDRVVLDFGRRFNDALLNYSQAEKLCQMLRGAAGYASKEPPTLVAGVWHVQVRMYDNYVAMRFTAPLGSSNQSRIPLTAGAARGLAERITRILEGRADRARRRSN